MTGAPCVLPVGQGRRERRAARLFQGGQQIGEEILEVFRETERRLCKGLCRTERAALSRALQSICRNAWEEAEDEAQIQ